MSTRFRKLFLAPLFVAGIAGCSFGTVADAEKDIERSRNDAVDLRATAAQPLPAADVSPVRVHQGVWLGSTAKRRENGQPLPRALEREGVTLVSASPLDLKGIADFLSEELKIPTYLDPDITNAGSGGNAQQAQPQDPQSSGEPMMGIPPIEGFPDSIFTDIAPMPMNLGSSDASMRINYKGKLSEFLNQVGAKFDVGWEYQDNSIRFFKNLTRTFMVKALPSVNEISMDISSDSGSGGGGDSSSSASQSSSTSASINMWEDLEKGFTEIVGDSGGRMNVSPSTGTVTISAPPATMRRVDNFVRMQNERFSKQVAISVQVLNVTLSDGDDYALDINGMFESFSGNTMFEFGSNTVEAIGGSGLNWSILRRSNRHGMIGTDGFIRALSSKGDVSVVTSASATTLNNIPTPLQVGTTRDYVSEVGVDREESGVTVDISTDSVTVGFNMQLLPRVLNDGRILLQYNISQSELAGAVDGFDVFEWQDQRIQLANVTNRSFSQQVEIPNNSTLVLSGFEQTRSSVSKSGTGHADNMLLGGSQRGSMEREVLVILISPVILDAGKTIVEL